MAIKDYPMNVLEDAGFEADDISVDMIWRLRKMIWSGVFSTERYRIYVKHYIEGLSETEIAEKLNKSENKIKREIARIKKCLRKNILSLAPGILQKQEEWLPPARLLYKNEDNGCDDEWTSIDEYFSISNLDISVRSYTALKRAGINTVIDIETIGLEGLRTLKGLNETHVQEIIREVKGKFVVDI